MKSKFIKQITNQGMKFLSYVIQGILGFSKTITNQQDEMTRGGF